MRILLLSLLPFLLLSCKSKKKTVPFTAETAVAVSSPAPAYTDSYYQLTVAGLPPQWRLMDRKEIKSIVPDGVVGGLRVGGLYTAVIVEPLNDVEVEDYSALIASNMTEITGSAEFPEITETSFSGQEARHFALDGVISGLPFRYECITFVHKGFGYQLLTWYNPSESKDSHLHVTEFIDCLSLLEGTPTLPPLESLPDVEAVGSRLQNGVFESSVFRFRVRPNENWRALLGVPLAQMDADAEVALEEPRRGLYLTVTASHQGKRAPATLSKLLQENTAALVESDPLATTAEPVSLQIDGEQVPFLSYDMKGDVPSRHYLGVFCRNGTALDIKAWHLKSDDPEIRHGLEEALAALEFLSEEEASALAAELDTSPVVQSGVGPGYSLRNGIYRNFARNYQWTRPGGLWCIETGDAARARNADSDLFARNLESDLYLQIIAEDAPGYTPAAYHKLVVDALREGELAPGVTKLPDHELKSATFQQTRLILGTKEDPTAFQLCTATIHGRAFQLFFWGSPESLTRGAEHLKNAIDGFSLPSSPLQAIEKTASSYRDHRVGWELRYPDKGWSPRRLPMAYDAIGSAVQFHQGKEFMQVMGIHLDTGTDQTQFVNTIVSQLLQVNFDRASSSGATKSPGTFAGQKATLIKGSSEGNSFRVATFSTGKTLWILMVGSNNDRNADTLFGKFEKGFRVLP